MTAATSLALQEQPMRELQQFALVASLVLGCSSKSDSPGPEAAPPAPTAMPDPPGVAEAHSKDELLGARVGQAIKALLIVRRDYRSKDYDDTLRRLTVLLCNGNDSRVDRLAGVPVEFLYPLERLDDAVAVGCDVFVTKNGERIFSEQYRMNKPVPP